MARVVGRIPMCLEIPALPMLRLSCNELLTTPTVALHSLDTMRCSPAHMHACVMHLHLHHTAQLLIKSGAPSWSTMLCAHEIQSHAHIESFIVGTHHRMYADTVE